MKTFAIMCTVSFETEVYVDAENLPEAMARLAKEGVCNELQGEYLPEVKFTPLDFIKPQVWEEDAGDYVPCNVIMFPVKEEVRDDAEFEVEI